MPATRSIRDSAIRLAKSNPRVRASLLNLRTRAERAYHSAALRVPALITPNPRNLTIALTAHCNLRCHGCRYGRDFMPNARLPLGLVNDLLDDAKAAGFQHVRLYGGEPLLHKDLPKIGARAVRLGLSPYVTTNGILLSKKIDELVDAGLVNFTVGFYGTGSDYDTYVQKHGAYRDFLASLRSVRERHGSRVNLRLNWLLRRQSCTVDAVRKAIAVAKELEAPIQVDLVHYSLPYFTEGPERFLQFRPEDRSAIDRVTAELLAMQRAHPRLLDHSQAGLASIPDWLLKGPDMRIPCDRYQMVWVGADGTVQLCYVTFKLGNLHETRLRDLMFTDGHRAAARAAFKVDCPNCHCGYDTRVAKHAPSHATYGAQARAITSTIPTLAGGVGFDESLASMVGVEASTLATGPMRPVVPIRMARGEDTRV